MQDPTKTPTTSSADTDARIGLAQDIIDAPAPPKYHTVQELMAEKDAGKRQALIAGDASTVTTQNINSFNRANNRRQVEHQQRRQSTKRRFRNLVKRYNTYLRKVVDRMPQGDRQEMERARLIERRDYFARLEAGLKW